MQALHYRYLFRINAIKESGWFFNFFIAETKDGRKRRKYKSEDGVLFVLRQFSLLG